MVGFRIKEMDDERSRVSVDSTWLPFGCEVGLVFLEKFPETNGRIERQSSFGSRTSQGIRRDIMIDYLRCD